MRSCLKIGQFVESILLKLTIERNVSLPLEHEECGRNLLDREVWQVPGKLSLELMPFTTRIPEAFQCVTVIAERSVQFESLRKQLFR